MAVAVLAAFDLIQLQTAIQWRHTATTWDLAVSSAALTAKDPGGGCNQWFPRTPYVWRQVQLIHIRTGEASVNQRPDIVE
ncbi:MAG: hypothetical protein ACRDQ9_15580 [Pseudonocardiaceae bacterium]